ncbi:MAG: glycoside hydrolase [Acetobacteraceae bacterium]|nr:glycoside hydrolase [Acetobacteraceae bacterium]
MSRPAPVLVLPLLLLSAIITFAWWWPNRPQAADPGLADTRINSVSFAPFRDGQSPLSDKFPSAAEVEQDVAMLAGRVRAIRTYAASSGDYDLASIAERHGLKLWLGIWLGTDRAKNALELARGIEIANAHPQTVERVIVGNEVLLRRDLAVGELIAALDQVKARVKQPVTYADVWEFWRQFPEVAAHVDLITIHLLPYWEDNPTGIDAAVGHVHEVYRQMQVLLAGKPIAIGETGWPSRGRWRRDAAPGRVNQAVFLRRFMELANQEGFDYNLIEAFDQGWKYKSEGTVGANWGLWSRSTKLPPAGPVTEDPRWAWKAIASSLAGLALLGGTLMSWPGLSGRLQIWLAVLAMSLGAALVYAWSGTVPVIYDHHLLLAAAVNLTGQALLAVLLMRRVAMLLAGRPLPPDRTGADATETIRGLFMLRVDRRWQVWLFHDLSFVFVWTAAVMQLLLLFDPRYRDFPLPVFAVPLVAILARMVVGDLPRGGGGREELWAGSTLAGAAIGSAIAEGPANLQSLAWNGGALLLAAPFLARARWLEADSGSQFASAGSYFARKNRDPESGSQSPQSLNRTLEKSILAQHSFDLEPS